MNKKIDRTKEEHPIFSIIPEKFTLVNTINNCDIYMGKTDRQIDGLKRTLFFHDYITMEDRYPSYVRLVNFDDLCIISFLRGEIKIVLFSDKEIYNNTIKEYFDSIGEGIKYKTYSID